MDIESLRDILSKALPPNSAVEFKKMFGGLMAYSQGRVFASISADAILSLKLDAATQTDFEKVGGKLPEQKEGQIPNKQYMIVPADLLGDVAKLGPWVAKSLAYVATLPAPVKKEKKTKTTAKPKKA